MRSTRWKKGLLAFGILLMVAVPVIAFSQTRDPYGLYDTAGSAQLLRSERPTEIAGRVIGAVLSLVGVIFFILTIYAGITWMVARGNEEQSKKALNTIIAAVIGLVIVFASYAITSFVLGSVSEGTNAPPPATTSPFDTGTGGAGATSLADCVTPGSPNLCVVSADDCGSGFAVNAERSCDSIPGASICCEYLGP